MSSPETIISRLDLEFLEQDTKETLDVWYREVPHTNHDYYYNNDGIRLIQAAQDFREGKGLKRHEKMQALDRWYVALELLKQANTIYSNRRGLRYLRIIIQLELWGIRILRRLPGKVKELEQKLKALKRMLENAKSNVRGAKIQAWVDVGLSVLSVALGPTGLMARALLAIDMFTVSTLVDYAFGPDEYGLSTVNNATGDFVGAAGKFGKKTPIVSGFVSLKLDLDEIENAEQQVVLIRQEVAKTAQLLESFVEFMEKHRGSIIKLRGRIFFQNKKAEQLFADIETAQNNYDILESDFEKLANHTPKIRR